MSEALNLSSDEIRQKFSNAMAEMYCSEVPDYQTVVDLVKLVNKETLDGPNDGVDLDHLSEERHGAIRLGKASELAMMRRLFAVLGMYPVGYYDLSVAGIPVHSTAFRPVSTEAIERCPFRIFTSLLRLDLIDDQDLREKAQAVLEQRNIFSDELIKLLEVYEAEGTFTESQTDQFISELVKTFKWNEEANVSEALYNDLHESHRLIADVVSFKGPHINHLTPRTLDIDQVQDRMANVGLNPKAVVEGPPKRQIPILLRQTAFKALNEAVSFKDDGNVWVEGSHTARFGEIEQRGIALTAKGQALYDQLLTKVRSIVTPLPDGSNVAKYYEVLEDVFSEFPDDEDILRTEKLAYFYYSLTTKGKEKGASLDGNDLDGLMSQGLVAATPITYEDFLPVSAAGIFQSNLGDSKGQDFEHNANQEKFEEALGAEVLDLYGLYESMENKSLQALAS